MTKSGSSKLPTGSRMATNYLHIMSPYRRLIMEDGNVATAELLQNAETGIEGIKYPSMDCKMLNLVESIQRQEWYTNETHTSGSKCDAYYKSRDEFLKDKNGGAIIMRNENSISEILSKEIRCNIKKLCRINFNDSSFERLKSSFQLTAKLYLNKFKHMPDKDDCEIAERAMVDVKMLLEAREIALKLIRQIDSVHEEGENTNTIDFRNTTPNDQATNIVQVGSASQNDQMIGTNDTMFTTPGRESSPGICKRELHTNIDITTLLKNSGLEKVKCTTPNVPSEKLPPKDEDGNADFNNVSEEIPIQNTPAHCIPLCTSISTTKDNNADFNDVSKETPIQNTPAHCTSLCTPISTTKRKKHVRTGQMQGLIEYTQKHPGYFLPKEEDVVYLHGHGLRKKRHLVYNCGKVKKPRRKAETPKETRE
uniref:BEN domain-containing protein n=1 Tax=Rhabditophanes sp. KR3021 TaxID=114890 RepID=A0AC35TNN5_9BILA